LKATSPTLPKGNIKQLVLLRVQITALLASSLLNTALLASFTWDLCEDTLLDSRHEEKGTYVYTMKNIGFPDEITQVLLMGASGSGKTSMRSLIL
jgi:hypothetical protein